MFLILINVLFILYNSFLIKGGCYEFCSSGFDVRESDFCNCYHFSVIEFDFSWVSKIVQTIGSFFSSWFNNSSELSQTERTFSVMKEQNDKPQSSASQTNSEHPSNCKVRECMSKNELENLKIQILDKLKVHKYHLKDLPNFYKSESLLQTLSIDNIVENILSERSPDKFLGDQFHNANVNHQKLTGYNPINFENTALDDKNLMIAFNIYEEYEDSL